VEVKVDAMVLGPGFLGGYAWQLSIVYKGDSMTVCTSAIGSRSPSQDWIRKEWRVLITLYGYLTRQIMVY